MNKEEAYENVVNVCNNFDRLTMLNALKLKESLEIIGKELFSPKEEEKKEEPKDVK